MESTHNYAGGLDISWEMSKFNLHKNIKIVCDKCDIVILGLHSKWVAITGP